MPNAYPVELKKEIIFRHTQGEFIPVLASEYQVSPSSIYRWRNLYCTVETPTHTYTPKEFDSMTLKLKKLENEKEILNLTGFLDDIPLQKKLMALEKIHIDHDQFSIHELCEALNVARGTFYNHIFRRKEPQTYADEQIQLMLKVQQIFDDSSQRFGAEKIRAVLATNGIQVSKRRVSAIMQELGLFSVRPDAKKQYQKREKITRQNLLQRDFSASHPNQIWVSDITCFKVNTYWLHLCVILDLYSRKVVGYQVAHNASTRLVTSTFRKAFAARGNPQNLTFHSDRGTQYTSTAFTKLLQTHRVKQSFSASGRPHDNAVAETFFANFKKEEAYRREYTSEQSFRKSVDRYMDFYNNLRPHQSLNYKIPSIYESNWLSCH